MTTQKTPPTLTINGVTMTYDAWSLATGIHEHTLRTRQSRHTDPAKILASPKKPFSKNDLELELNDTPLDKLPKHLAKLVTQTHHGKPIVKYGRYLRDLQRAAFDKHFEAVRAARNSETNAHLPEVVKNTLYPVGDSMVGSGD